jgi:DNA-binding transcriptional MerR regulator
MTGLSIDTLRAWERRHSVVKPRRNNRGRVYTSADVERLKMLRELVARGHAIGSLADSSDARLTALLESASDEGARSDTPAAGLGEALTALDRYDPDVLEASLNRYAVVLPPSDFVFAVIVPLLQEVGRRWENGDLRPAQEHLVSAAARNVLGGLLRGTVRPNASPRIVFATPSGERHELGLLSAALLAASDGWGVVYLGSDLPASDIQHAVKTTAARILMISLTSPEAVAKQELIALAGVSADVALWVGGPQAEALLKPAGGRAKHVPALTSFTSLLRENLG